MPLYLATAHGKHYPLTQISDTTPINNIAPENANANANDKNCFFEK